MTAVGVYRIFQVSHYSIFFVCQAKNELQIMIEKGHLWGQCLRGKDIYIEISRIN